MEYRHSETKDVVSCNYCFLWTLLIGPFYFLIKENYKHAVLSFLVACVTFGVSWLVYPFFAKEVMTNFLRKKGYKPHEGRHYSTEI